MSHEWDLSEGYGVAKCVRCGVWAGATAAFGDCIPKLTQKIEGNDFKVVQNAVRDKALEAMTNEVNADNEGRELAKALRDDADYLLKAFGRESLSKRLCKAAARLMSR